MLEHGFIMLQALTSNPSMNKQKFIEWQGPNDPKKDQKYSKDEEKQK